MNDVTLPHAGLPSREIILGAIQHHTLGVTVRELQQGLVPNKSISQKILRDVLDAMEQDGAIESEQYRSETKFYFIAGKTPRVRARCLPAEVAPAPIAARTSWWSALGALPC